MNKTRNPWSCSRDLFFRDFINVIFMSPYWFIWIISEELSVRVAARDLEVYHSYCPESSVYLHLHLSWKVVMPELLSYSYSTEPNWKYKMKNNLLLFNWQEFSTFLWNVTKLWVLMIRKKHIAYLYAKFCLHMMIKGD